LESLFEEYPPVFEVDVAEALKTSKIKTVLFILRTIDTEEGR
jgi:hypothetical protein